MAKKKVVFPILITTLFVLFFNYVMGSKSNDPNAPSFTSSKNCKECHEEIYNHWKNAMHSMSIEDPIFKASYMEAYLNTAGEAKFNCLRCHAPITLINKVSCSNNPDQ
jgi:hypothetical protein